MADNVKDILSKLKKNVKDTVEWHVPLDAFEARVLRVHRDGHAMPLLTRETAQILSIIRETSETRTAMPKLIAALELFLEEIAEDGCSCDEIDNSIDRCRSHIMEEKVLSILGNK